MKKRIHVQSIGNRVTKIYRDLKTRKYIVRLYVNESLYKNADYFTDDRKDAFDTAQALCVK